MMSMQDEFAEGRYWDQKGKPWDRASEMVEPATVKDMLATGVPWMIERCDEMPELATEQELVAQVIPKLAGKKDWRKAMRKNKSKTMFVAEEWVDDASGSMLIFVEGPPAPRAKNWFY